MDNLEQVEFFVGMKKYSLPVVKKIISSVFSFEINPNFKAIKVVEHPVKKDSFIVFRKSEARKGEASDYYIATEASIKDGRLVESKSSLETLGNPDVMHALVIKTGDKNVVSHFEVNPQLRNHGIGTDFIDHMMGESLAENVDLHFPASSGHPESLYKSKGFTRTIEEESVDGYSEKFAIKKEDIRKAAKKESKLNTLWPRAPRIFFRRL